MIKEIAKKYENVQKGVGDMMRGALIETEARTILNQGIRQGMSEGRRQGISEGRRQGMSEGIRQGMSEGMSEAQRKIALRMLRKGEQTVEQIAEDTELSVAEVERLKGHLTGGQP